MQLEALLLNELAMCFMQGGVIGCIWVTKNMRHGYSMPLAMVLGVLVVLAKT